MKHAIYKWLRSKCRTMVMASALLLFCADAHALTIEDIKSMASLPEETLMSIVTNAQDLPKLSKEEIKDLQKAGIPDKVTAAIVKRKVVLDKLASGSAAPSSSSDKTIPREIDTTPANSDNKPPETAPTPPIPAFDQANAPVPAPPEGSNADSTDGNAASDVGFIQIQGAQETILAPVESSNLPIIFRKFFQDAYETYTVQSEIAKKYADLQSITAAERAAEAEMPRVAQWVAQIATHPVSSLESCINMMDELNPGMDTLIGAALNQCIGLALHALGADGMASAYLDQALQSISTVPNYSATLKTFFETAHRTDYTSTSPLRIKTHVDDIDDSVRQPFLYFIAYSLVYGAQPDITYARQLLSNISEGSIYSARAHILLATLAVRAPEFKFKTAAEHLNTAIETLDKLDDEAAYELKNSAWLALARIAFENHAYDIADAFYRKVDINSHHLRDALIEDAWGQLFAGNYSGVLSITHALYAPIFKKAWLPDLKLLEAGAYLALCRYDMADLSIEAMRNTILADATKLKAYVAQTPARDYYNQIIQAARDPQNAIIPASIYHRVIADQTFKMLHQSIRILTQEQNRLAQYTGYGFNAWPKLRQVYTQAIETRQQHMSVVLSQIYEKALSELHALDISASQVAIEIRLAKRTRDAECLKIVAAGGKCESEIVDDSRAQLQKRDNDAWWNFDGEFWRDEIRSYVSGVTSLCK